MKTKIKSLIIGLIILLPIHSIAQTLTKELERTIESNKNINGQKRQRKLLNEIKKLQTEKEEEFKVEQINFMVNKLITYQSDLLVWNQIDYWTAPLELLDKGMGDCEDYAIAKYYSLLKLGIKEEKLKLLLVNYKKENSIEKHVVLAYWKSNIEVWILDINPRIEHINDRKELEILNSFDVKGFYNQLTEKEEESIFKQRWLDAQLKSRKEGW